MKIPLLTGVLLLAGLAACGGSDHDHGGAPSPGMPPPVGADMSDKFLSQVASVAAAAPEDAEPALLDDSPPTTPDSTEPAPIGP
jgi:hypothetical protein